MELTKQTVGLIRDYAKTLVNAGVMDQGELSETICRLRKIKKKAAKTVAKEERLVSKKEFARLLGYRSPRTIDRLEKKGAIERVHSACGQVRYKISEVEKFIGM